MQWGRKGVSKEIVDRAVPLFWQDVLNALEEEGWRGSLRSAPGAVGVSVQTFRTPEQRYWERMGGVGRLAEQDESLRKQVVAAYKKQKEKKAPLFYPPWRKRKVPTFTP